MKREREGGMDWGRIVTHNYLLLVLLALLCDSEGL